MNLRARRHERHASSGKPRPIRRLKPCSTTLVFVRYRRFSGETLAVRIQASAYPGSLAGGLHASQRFQTTQGRAGARHDALSHVAFRFSPQRRHPGPSTFRGSILCPHVPLPTLRCHPHGRQRMTRGRRDCLYLRRTEIASATTLPVFPAHVAVGTAIARRPTGRRRRSPASGSHRT